MRRLPNGHLHLALGAAFLSCTLLAFAVPVPGSARTGSTTAPVDELSITKGWVASRATNVSLDERPALQLRTEPVPFTLHENGLSTAQLTTGVTVADALGDAGIELSRVDAITPAPATVLDAGMHVYIRYASRLSVRVAGKETEILTQAATVGDALNGAGYDLQAADVVMPDRATGVVSGMVVGLTTIRESKESHDTPIPHETVYRYDANLSNGTRVVTQEGADGYHRKESLVKKINGTVVYRAQLGENTIAPTAEIVSIGTREIAAAPETVSAAAGSAPDGSACAQTVQVWSTFYTAASAGGTRTATGTGVYKGIVAVDPRYIPLGTRMYVPGYGYAIAADTGGGVKGWWLDVAYGEGDTIDWYSHYVDICLLA